MLVDYHIHTELCGHAQGDMEEYVQAAIDRGLVEMGFNDHLPMYFRPVAQRDATIAMAEEEVPGYLERVRQLAQTYPEIKIKAGMEADYIPGVEPQLKEILARYQLDYVYGSIHFLDGWGFDDSRFLDGYNKWDISELYGFYFNTLQKAAASGLFDVLGHPDLIKKFGYRPPQPLDALLEETVRSIGSSGVAIELNTAGWRVKAQEQYPSVRFLEFCHHYGVPVTLGSDAHKPEQVAYEFNRAAALLRDIGFTQLATFKARQRFMVELE
ncbi:MAG: histidinol-phosphatase HisJ family protein [Clostridia bacterium]|nr:histidinol-phosphatase HisJ family protein [Clostridia bacterium]